MKAGSIMKVRSSLGLVGALCAMALALPGIAQAQASPPAAPARLPAVALPLITPAPPAALTLAYEYGVSPLPAAIATPAVLTGVVQANPDFAKPVAEVSPAPVIKMSSGEWLYLSGSGGGVKCKMHQVTLWVSNTSPPASRLDQTQAKP